MIKVIIEDKEYKNLVSKQVLETIEFLLSKDLEFAITANIEGISFEPELPKSIYEKLAKFSLFVLSNYTYTSIKLSKDSISFEAGFGAESFGCLVTVPFSSVFQVVIDESILLVNPVATVAKFNQKEAKKSLNVFKNNPKNKDLL